MPSVTSLLENHHPSLSPIPGSPAHTAAVACNGNANNPSSANTANNNSPSYARTKPYTSNYDNLVSLARNLQSAGNSNSSSPSHMYNVGQQKPNVSASNSSASLVNNYANQHSRYAVIANRLQYRSNAPSPVHSSNHLNNNINNGQYDMHSQNPTPSSNYSCLMTSNNLNINQHHQQQYSKNHHVGSSQHFPSPYIGSMVHQHQQANLKSYSPQHSLSNNNSGGVPPNCVNFIGNSCILNVNPNSCMNSSGSSSASNGLGIGGSETHGNSSKGHLAVNNGSCSNSSSNSSNISSSSGSSGTCASGNSFFGFNGRSGIINEVSTPATTAGGGALSKNVVASYATTGDIDQLIPHVEICKVNRHFQSCSIN